MSPAELILFPDGTGYRRTGECDGCRRPGLTVAQCCTYVLLPDRDLTEDESYWLALHELDASAPRNQRIPARCAALTGEGRCSLVGHASRPSLCSNYPELPGLDPGCSYTFQEIA